MLALRAAFALITATLYKVAMAPLALAGYVLVPFAIWFGEYRTGLNGERIFTAPRWLEIYGNSQEGYDPPWAIEQLYQGWPTFWRRYSWAAHRNRIRNVPFVPALAWLHKPKGELVTRVTFIGPVMIRVRTRGWHTEVEYVWKRRFGDFGPRLDQPDRWGAVSWAFRPWGKF